MVASHPLRISVIIPALNEALVIEDCIASIRQACPPETEIVVADGGSADQTVPLVRQLGITVVSGTCGRATQMNAGAAVATGGILVFLHADTRLPANAGALLEISFRKDEVLWGRFDVRLVSGEILLGLVGVLMGLRSRLTGIATGDQAIFVRRDAFERIGGFPIIPLMEDIAISKCLKALAPPRCLSARVLTSARRWQKHGVLRTILLMWQLRWLYYRGAHPERLVRLYETG
jgi:rSAM/selenodomain-associated transferase 2